ncbi:hypothetical protein NC651_023822 [Populus alba x Populus x berolinensis]|nr:hypothetical protein NC651_023822 [Populus alba x Populus x berolinensis]
MQRANPLRLAWPSHLNSHSSKHRPFFFGKSLRHSAGVVPIAMGLGLVRFCLFRNHCRKEGMSCIWFAPVRLQISYGDGGRP